MERTRTEDLTARWVDPGTWSRLEPVAVAADRRERAVTRRLAVVLVLAVAAAFAVPWLGLWAPNLRLTGSGGGEGNVTTRTGSWTAEVDNTGLLPVTVTGLAAGRDAAPAGLTVTRVESVGELPARSTGRLLVEVRVDDCSRWPALGDPATGDGTLAPDPQDGRTDGLLVTTTTWHGEAVVDLGEAGRTLLPDLARMACGR